MTSAVFDQLIEKADLAARQGDWTQTIIALQQAETLQPDHAGVLTGMGTCLIQINQLEEAIPYFQKVTRLAPESAEAHNNLGVSYMCARAYDDAERAYKEAIAVNPDHLPAWKNLATLYLQQPEKASEGVQVLASIVKKHPDDVESLMLLAECYEAGDEIESAVTLYSRVLSIEPENQVARAKIEKYRPAQGVLGGHDRAELVKKLSALKKLKPMVAEAEKAEPKRKLDAGWIPAETMKVGVFASEGAYVYDRTTQLAQLISRTGKEVEVNSEVEALSGFDFLIFGEPILSGSLIKRLNACIQKGIPFALDIGRDYFNIPENHPGFNVYGPGNPASLHSLEIMLKAASSVIVPSKVLAERMKDRSANVKVILPNWDCENPLWTKKTSTRDTINIGWIGCAADRADLFTIKKHLLRILRNYPETRLMVTEDLEAYKGFAAISERRRGFLPATSVEDLPYQLMQFDILVVPKQNTPYNQASSDELLMAAGVRKIPWAASSFPAFEDWRSGGVLVADNECWYETLAEMVENAGLRRTLGESGEQKALTRNSVE